MKITHASVPTGCTCRSRTSGSTPATSAARVVRRDAGADRDRGRPRRLGRGQGRGRQHRHQARWSPAINEEFAPLLDRRGRARHHAAVGRDVQRHARATTRCARGHVFPVLGRRGITVRRSAGIDMRAVGPARQIARPAGVAPARRPAARAHAGLRLGRLGAGRPDRRAAAGLRRARRLQGRQDAGRRRRRRRSTTRSAACAPRARGWGHGSTSCATRTAP